MWFHLHASGLDFCDRSPHRIVTEARLPCSAARAFDLLSSDRDLGLWLHDFVSCRWTSDPPHGVGSTRDVALKLLSVKEEFLAWSPGERLTFAITASTLPLMRRAVEDLRLFPAGPSETRLLWTVHYELRTWARPLHPLARAIFVRLFARSAENVARLARERG